MAKFLLDKDTLTRIQSLVEKRSDKQLVRKLADVHYADIAEIAESLSVDDAIYLVKLLDSEKTADALAEVDEDFREKILTQLSAKEIAEEIEELDTDDAADLIAELPEERKEKVMSEISDSEHLKDIRELLTYEENTAGALMAKELVKVQEDLSILKCVNEMRAQAEYVTRVHSIYVVNDKNKLIGRLSLKDLLTANSKAKVKDIYIPKVDFVEVDEDVEEVAKIMSKYDLEAIPVVNNKNELLGRITICLLYTSPSPRD